MTTRNMIAALGAIAAFAVAGTLHAEAYTSASYVQGGLIAQWDGIDNAGTGTHDPNATVWKDLVGNLNMTLTAKGRWNMLGNALYVSGMGAQGPSAAPAYKTIEIVFKMKRDGGRIMFASGLQSRLVGVDPASGSPKTIYFNGKGSSGGNDKCFKWSLDTEALCTATATYTGDNVADVYCDGAVRNDGNNANNWGVGDAKVAVGGRLLNETYPWFGEIYAIRLYDTVLTAEEIAANAAIDRARFQPTESSLYVQDGLIAQWDGKDNAGRGVHDAAATAWKDLVGGLDLSLTENGSWSAGGNALVVNGPSAVGETAAPAYQTIEIAYRMTRSGGRILLNSGDDARHVLFDANKVYLDASYYQSPTTPYASYALNTNEVCSLAGVYEGDSVASLYFDGAQRNDGLHNNYFSSSKTLVLGGRLMEGFSSYPWYGEIYAIRLYSRRLTKSELAHNNKIDRLRFLSSKNYKGYDALLAQWDGENNFAAGVAHNPEAATWNDLKGAYDLTLSANGSWTASGNGLVANGAAAYRNSAAPAYRTFEVAYRETSSSGRFLFNSGNSGRQIAVFSTDGKDAWFSGLSGSHQKVHWNSFDATAMRTVAATYTNALATAEFAYCDGVKRSDGTKSDSWSSCESKIIVGDNKTGGYRAWYGEVYAIRLYNRELTDAEIAFNSALDKKRVAFGAKTVTWGGGDGEFSTKDNWTGGALPRYMDNAVVLSGTASIEEEVVSSISVGADAVLSLTVPDDAGTVPLTILGGVTAETGAGLQLDAAAFSKKHPQESITIIECGKDSTAALNALAANLSFVNTSLPRRGTVAVADGTRLVYTAPQKPGTTIAIR